MRILIQRVAQASVSVGGECCGSIRKGLLLLVGFEAADTSEDLEWAAAKVTHLRIFNDADGVMNLSVLDTAGQLLVVSQFTLHASTKKGNRPSYTKAARPAVAIPLYKQFVALLSNAMAQPVATGIFGADMQVSLTNDGPVTIWIDTKTLRSE